MGAKGLSLFLIFGIFLIGFSQYGITEAYAGFDDPCEEIVTIDNGLPRDTIGFFEVEVECAGDSETANLLPEEREIDDILFDLLSFYETTDGVFRLAETATLGPELTPENEVMSWGEFTGSGGQTIFWTAISTIPPGEQNFNTDYIFDCPSCDTDFGGLLRFHSYLDEDVPPFFSNCLLFTRGSVGTGDLQLFTFDSVFGYGISHGGAFGSDLVGATFDGWAADEYSDLLDVLEGGDAPPVSLAGIIDTESLPLGFDPELGMVYGPEDITTVMSYTLDGIVSLEPLSVNLLPAVFAGGPSGVTATVSTGLGGSTSSSSIPSSPTTTTDETDGGGSGDYHTGPTFGVDDLGNLQVNNGFKLFQGPELVQQFTLEQFHTEALVKAEPNTSYTFVLEAYSPLGADAIDEVKIFTAPKTFIQNDKIWEIHLIKDKSQPNGYRLEVTDPQGKLTLPITFTVSDVGSHKIVSITVGGFEINGAVEAIGLWARDTFGYTTIAWVNDGLKILDIFSYPSLIMGFEELLSPPMVCTEQEDPDNRYSCAFEIKRNNELEKAKAALAEISKPGYQTQSDNQAIAIEDFKLNYEMNDELVVVFGPQLKNNVHLIHSAQ